MPPTCVEQMVVPSGAYKCESEVRPIAIMRIPWHQINAETQIAQRICQLTVIGGTILQPPTRQSVTSTADDMGQAGF
jgi:hypothetical protein